MSDVNTNQTYVAPEANNKNYLFPLSAMTTLFFLWGFITVLNDVLIPRLKAVFDLTFTEAMLIQFCFFSAYFIVSLPAGYLVKRFGYKNGVITGLVIAAAGCLMFYPAAAIQQYWIFLSALFVLASGVTILQVSANPYVAALGPEKTAASRLNLAQAMNSLGTTVGPKVGSLLILGSAGTLAAEAAADSVKIPYLILAAALLTIAVVFAWLKLPEITAHNDPQDDEKITVPLTQAPHLIFGVLAIFFYVGGEVAIGSFMINYFGEAHIGGLSEHEAAALLTLYWGGAMVGRFIGSYVMRFIAPATVLLVNAVTVVLLLVITTQTSGTVAMYSVLAIGLFNSIMFPTIFTLAIDSLGSQTSKGSGWLCLAIVGGAIVPLIQGVVADSVALQISFLVPAVCYVYIAFYGFKVPSMTKVWQSRIS